jgi:metal-sulfur cluster biosynthetic enzyme
MIKEEDIIESIKTVIDPEVGFDVYSMGLIYDIIINDDETVKINMTLSTKGCPLHELMKQWVKDAVLKVEGVKDCEIEIVWEPAWNASMANDEVKKAMGG